MANFLTLKTSSFKAMKRDRRFSGMARYESNFSSNDSSTVVRMDGSVSVIPTINNFSNTCAMIFDAAALNFFSIGLIILAHVITACLLITGLSLSKKSTITSLANSRTNSFSNPNVPRVCNAS